MDFVRSHFFTNETLTSCPFFSFFYHFWLGLLLHPTKSDKKNEKRGNWSEFHFSEVTSYKIHTLGTVKKFELINWFTHNEMAADNAKGVLASPPSRGCNRVKSPVLIFTIF